MENNYINQKYAKSTSIVHWLTALLILVSYPTGKYMESIALIDKIGLIKIHVITGNIVFILTILRCIFYFTKERPIAIETGSKINDGYIKVTYTLFYLLLLSISITGIVKIVFNGYHAVVLNSDITKVLPQGEAIPTAHGFMSFIMMLLLAGHVIGVLLHYIKTKENLLKRIWG